MSRFLLFISIVLIFSCISYSSLAQSDQVVNNGDKTNPAVFPGTGCIYDWVNSNPAIGLPASGRGTIPSFTAVNTGNTAITANITATLLPDWFAYITKNGDNAVTVIDITKNKVTGYIQLGAPSGGVAVSHDGGKVYITQGNSGVGVINTLTNTEEALIQVGSQPSAVAISNDDSRVYVVNQNDQNVSVINTATNTVINTVSVGVQPDGIAVSPDGSKVYVSNTSFGSGRTVSVINTSTYAVTLVTIGSAPGPITISPDGSRVYVGNINDNTVSVINTANNIIVATIFVGNVPEGIAISPDGSRVYVADFNDNAVSVINSTDNSIVTTVPVGAKPEGISVSPDGSHVYVANANDNTVSVIDAATNTVSSILNVGSGPVAFGNFITGGTGCSATPVTFKITINPGFVAPLITVGKFTGNISACAGTASASPNIGKFTVSGSNLTANVIVTAPPGLEVSVKANSGYTGSITLKPQAVNQMVSNTVIYVRSAASAAAGRISANITLTSVGAVTQNVAVTGIVNALPSANKVPNQVVNNGQPTTAVNFTGTGGGYTWTNDKPGIGLPANGTGDIASFIAINNTGSPVVATITVYPMPLNSAYIANYGSNTVSVIDLKTNAVTAIPVGVNPEAVAVSPDGSRVFVANSNPSGDISVINTATNKVLYAIATGMSPTGLAVSPDGNTLYASITGSNAIGVINIPAGALVNDIPVGSEPFGIAVGPDGSRAYVANFNDGTVSVINTATNKVIATVTVGLRPVSTLVSADGSKVFVTNQGSNSIAVINTATNVLETNIAVGQQPTGLALSPDGGRIYVTNEYSDAMSVLDAATYQVIASIGLDGYPYGISVSADGSRIVAANNLSNSVSIIDALTNKVLAEPAVGSKPYSTGNFIAGGSGCPGVPVTFTITVNPTNSTAVINAGTVTGNIVSCQGTASSSPNIQQFTVSGSGLTSDIIAAAPANFEVSLSANSGYAGSVRVAESAGTVNNTTIYVRSAANASAGNISDNIVFSSAGITLPLVTVTGFINALPSVNPVGNQLYTNGDVTAAINLAGSGNAFSWVNNTPGIGLAASGSGDIPSFTAVNNGSTNITATITVTPSSSGYAYIANSSSNTVSVVNTSTNKIDKTIPVDLQPYGVTVSHNGSRVYVTNENSGTVSVIDANNNTVITTITVGSFPLAVATNPGDDRVYVSNANSNSVSVIDAATDKVITEVAVTGPGGLYVSPDGHRLYVTESSSSSVAVINTTTNLVDATIPVSTSPFGVVTSPDGKIIYVSNIDDNSVTVVNAISNSTIAKVNVEVLPHALAISPDGNRLYVDNYGSGNISVINTATNSVLNTFPVGKSPFGISVSSDGSELYATSSQDNTLTVMNAGTGAITNVVPVGTYPTSFGNFIKAGTGCSGAPVTFTITVKPKPGAAGITVNNNSGSEPLTTVYGTPSTSESFSFSATGLAAGVLVTPPAGFEVSTDGKTFSSTVTVGTGGAITNSTVYIRLAATTPVGPYQGNITLSSTGIPDVDDGMAVSTVTPSTLTITADNKTRAFGIVNPVLTASYAGFVNNETSTVLTTPPVLATTAVITSPGGQYPITVSGAAAPNYTVTYVQGVLTIVQEGATIVIPNTFTPNGDGINDTWEIKNLNSYLNCTVEIYNRYGENVYSSIGYGNPWKGTFKSSALPTGTYYYIIDLKNDSKVLSGFVAIIR